MCHHADSDECMGCEVGCLRKSAVAPSIIAQPGDVGSEVLTRQSLEGGAKCTCGKDSKDCCKAPKLKKGLTVGEAIERAMTVHKLSKESAEKAVKILFPA